MFIRPLMTSKDFCSPELIQNDLKNLTTWPHSLTGFDEFWRNFRWTDRFRLFSEFLFVFSVDAAIGAAGRHQILPGQSSNGTHVTFQIL